ADGQVCISTVPPELVREMLPPGLLQHTFDITVQAPGIPNFTTPAPMTFPNVFGAPPGSQLDVLSFDHTTGRLVIEGTATVSADGRSVTTDPGVGITHPGWHGLTPPGKCVEAAFPTYVRDQGKAQQVVSGAYDVVSGVNDIFDSVNSLAKTKLPVLPSSLGGVFAAFDIFSDIRDVFDPNLSTARRYEAGFKVALSIGLLLQPEAGLVWAMGELTSL